MQKQIIYKNLARYYDLIYSRKDYKKESAIIRQLISKYKKSKGNDLLEVACGTGKHAQYFKNYFRVLATDVSSGMLAVARKNLKGVAFKRADMTNLNLGKKFDVIVCLFSSIGYVKTYKNLEKTLNNFAHHLKRGGMVIVEPWFNKASYRIGSIHLTVYEDDEIKIARESVSGVSGNISVLDMHYLIAERNKKIRHFLDRHELGMFEPRRVLGFMEGAGLKARLLKNTLTNNRGVYIGIKK